MIFRVFFIFFSEKSEKTEKQQKNALKTAVFSLKNEDFDEARQKQ